MRARSSQANGSAINWAGNLAYNGSTISIPSSVTSNASQYRYVNPQLTSPPALPSGSAPWASATPAWSVGAAFTLQATSPAIGAGANPTAAMTSDEASSAQPFLSTDLAGKTRTHNDVGAYAG